MTCPATRRIALNLAALVGFSLLCASQCSARPTSVAQPAIDDTASHVDVNMIDMIVTNRGSFGRDSRTFNGGLEFPRGSGRTAMFAGGLWLGALNGPDTLVTASEYVDDYGPGAMVGGTFDLHSRLEYRAYELLRRYPATSSRDSALAAYQAGAVPYGAPEVNVLPDGSLDILGDQMLWTVYNDADPARRISRAGGTAPLGIEVQQTTFAYHRPGALDNTVFLSYRMIHKGAAAFTTASLSLWSDVDLGATFNDLVGCDTTRDLGFCYDADNNDPVYAGQPVALGIDLLRGPRGSGSNRLRMNAFSKYIGGDDPMGASEFYRLMVGMRRDGSPFVNPITGLPSSIFAPGDPVTATGWRDTIPSDRRLMVNAGPFTMAPGDTQNVLAAIVIGQSADHLQAITALRDADDYVQKFSDALFDPASSATGPAGVALVFPGAVNLNWQLQGVLAAGVTIERFNGGAWKWLADVASNELGQVFWTDQDVDPGQTYFYQLAWPAHGNVYYFGQTSATVPTGPLQIAGFRPNPAAHGGSVAFSLASRAPTRLQVLDLAGRRVLDRELTPSSAGPQLVPLVGTMRSGVYLIRVTQGGRTVTGRGVVLN
jgi:hypothetical protein